MGPFIQGWQSGTITYSIMEACSVIRIYIHPLILGERQDGDRGCQPQKPL